MNKTLLARMARYHAAFYIANQREGIGTLVNDAGYG